MRMKKKKKKKHKAVIDSSLNNSFFVVFEFSNRLDIVNISCQATFFQAKLLKLTALFPLVGSVGSALKITEE